jgi:hypothetical protein
MPTNIVPADWFLHLYHAQFGKIGFIQKVMSAYRKHSGGMWWGAHEDFDRLIFVHGTEMMNTYEELFKMFQGEPEKEKIISDRISTLIYKLSEIDKAKKSKILQQALDGKQELLKSIVEYQSREIATTEKRMNDIIATESLLSVEIDTLKNELNRMKGLMYWKVRAKISAIGRDLGLLK